MLKWTFAENNRPRASEAESPRHDESRGTTPVSTCRCADVHPAPPCFTHCRRSLRCGLSTTEFGRIEPMARRLEPNPAPLAPPPRAGLGVAADVAPAPERPVAFKTPQDVSPPILFVHAQNPALLSKNPSFFSASGGCPWTVASSRIRRSAPRRPV
jgi:hypothetical protein